MRLHTSELAPFNSNDATDNKRYRFFFFVIHRVLERIGARALSAHLRKLCDYLAFEFTISGQNNINISKLIDAVNSLMWKYNVVTLDRLVLCLVSHSIYRVQFYNS